MRWIALYALVLPILAMSNEDNMCLTIDDNESLSNAFNIMKSCFTSTNHSTSCNVTDSLSLNQCRNSSVHLICCKSHTICYNSIDVVFMSGNYTIKGKYRFTNLQNVRFSGSHSDSGTPPTIKCSPITDASNDNSGLAFIQVKNLTIEYLNIIGCGMNHTSTSTSTNGDFITHFSALYVQNSTDLLVSNVSISNSNGTGLSIVDTNGTINIINSSFSNNRITIPAELSTMLSGGGGVYIEYTECAPGVRGCNSSDYLLANNSVIVIENCTFQQNHAMYDFSNSLTDNLDNNVHRFWCWWWTITTVQWSRNECFCTHNNCLI